VKIGVKQTSIDIGSLPEKIKATFRRRAYNQMISILKEINIDCILSFYLLNAGYLALFASRELNIPFIAGVRGNDIGRNIFHTQRFGVIQSVIQGADKIVCVNEHLKGRMLIAFPEAERKTSIIPNSIMPFNLPDKNISRSKILKATGWNEDDLIVVFSGSLREKKGVVPLTNALRICGYSHAIKLLVVGPNIGKVEQKMCGKLWDRLKVDNIIYTTGQIPRKDVCKWVIGGDVIVMPSLDDGMANGLLEGMLMGLCPIVSEIFSDVIKHNHSGIIVSCKNAESISDAFITISRNKNKAKALGGNAQTVIHQHHNPKAEASKYIEIFKGLLNNE
jgi:glycosyltransferase involved in cell wall biosynthesis